VVASGEGQFRFNTVVFGVRGEVKLPNHRLSAFRKLTLPAASPMTAYFTAGTLQSIFPPSRALIPSLIGEFRDGTNMIPLHRAV
jgi:hypothetical protein